MSSRIIYSQLGRPVAVEITTPDMPGLEVGFRYLVVGTEISMTSDRIQFTGSPTGRSPLPAETAAVRKRAGSHNGVEDDHRPWTDDDREQARRLQAEGLSQATMLATLPRPHRDLTSSAFDGSYGRDGMMVKRNRLRSEPWRTTAASTRASRSRSR